MFYSDQVWWQNKYLSFTALIPFHVCRNGATTTKQWVSGVKFSQPDGTDMFDIQWAISRGCRVANLHHFKMQTMTVLLGAVIALVRGKSASSLQTLNMLSLQFNQHSTSDRSLEGMHAVTHSIFPISWKGKSTGQIVPFQGQPRNIVQFAHSRIVAKWRWMNQILYSRHKKQQINSSEL